MFISRKYKFIFIHIPKTGGTSIRHAMYDMDDNSKKKECFLHSDVNYSKAYLKRNGEKWNDFFTFSIVRNPYARMVSFYNHLKRIRKENLEKVELFKNHPKRNGNDKRTNKEIEESIIQFSRFADRYNYKDFKDFIENPYYHMKDLNPRKLNFVANYVDWLSDEKGIAVKYIMKLEDANNCWDEVLSKIGCEKIELPHLKKGENVDWKDYYTKRLKDIVYKRFKRDFEYFNYDKEF